MERSWVSCPINSPTERSWLSWCIEPSRALEARSQARRLAAGPDPLVVRVLRVQARIGALEEPRRGQADRERAGEHQGRLPPGQAFDVAGDGASVGLPEI